MKIPARSLPPRSKQQGALLILTLVILLVVSMLGMATVDTTGLEMKMSSNSRAQQLAFEAAEYTLSWVENDIVTSGYFSADSIENKVGCNNVCFSNACVNGYCFYGSAADSWQNCQASPNAGPEPYESAALWTDGSGRFQTLDIPNTDITTKYIVEFWCYTAKDPAFDMADGNYSRMYRITAYAIGEGGRARAMLRSTIKEV